MLILGIGLMCVCKLNASCNEYHAWRMKCEYPGKTNIRVGSGAGAGSDNWTEGGGDRHDDGGDEDGCDDDGPTMECIG